MKNIKYLLVLPALASMMTSCSNDDSPAVAPSTPTAITFTSQVAPSTKASIFDTDQLHTDGFRVIAVDHAADWSTLADTDKTPNFMYHQAITWDATLHSYQYDRVKYWPVDGNQVSFFAYSPGDAATPSSNTATESPNLVYTAPALSTEQVDLVTATALNRTASTASEQGNGTVYFEFSHALSKIGFAAKLKDQLQAGYSLTVKSLRLRYVATDEMSSIINKGTYYMDTNTWTLDTTSTYTATAEGEGENLLAGDINVTSSTENTALNADNKYLMYIPQVYEEGTLEVDITYVTRYQDPNNPDAAVVASPENTRTLVLPAILGEADDNIGWQQNQSYTYVIELSPDAVNTGDAQVRPWHTRELL